jgi:hypothetical protein
VEVKDRMLRVKKEIGFYVDLESKVTLGN